MRGGPWVAALLAAATSGCADRSAPGTVPRVERLDSAGVQVVTLSGSLDAPAAGAVDPAPLASVGALDGAPEEQFARVVDVKLLRDGLLAVAEAQSNEIRVFDARGTYVTTFGRPGEGPGELRGLGSIAAWAGDTVAAYDPVSARITLFDARGGPGRIVTLDAGPRGRPFRVLLGADASLARSRWFAGFGAPGGDEAEFVRDSMVYRWFDATGTPGDTVAVLPDAELLRRVQMVRGQVNVAVTFAALGRSAHSALDPGRGAWMAPNDRFELRFYERSGMLRRIVRAPERDRPFEAGEVDAFRAARLDAASGPEERTRVAGWLDDSPVPPLRPAFGGLLVDDRGRLWVGEYDPLDPPRRWLVLGREGEALGAVVLPVGVRLFDVRGDRVAGVVTDALDVPHVVVHALRWKVAGA